MENKQPKKLEWSAPVLKVITVDATESGSAESTQETIYVFPKS